MHDRQGALHYVVTELLIVFLSVVAEGDAERALATDSVCTQVHSHILPERKLQGLPVDQVGHEVILPCHQSRQLVHHLMRHLLISLQELLGLEI